MTQMQTGTMRRPVVLVDMDGVQADFEAGFWAQWALLHPLAPQRDDVDPTVFNITDRFAPVWRDRANAVKNTPGFYRGLPAVVGAADALNAMRCHGWDVLVCTAPLLSNPACASDKLAWMESVVGPGWASRTIVVKDKGIVAGDVLIDDKPRVSSRFVPTWTHVIFDAPYNQTSAAPVRLGGWANWQTVLTPLLEAAA